MSVKEDAKPKNLYKVTKHATWELANFTYTSVGEGPKDGVKYYLTYTMLEALKAWTSEQDARWVVSPAEIKLVCTPIVVVE